MMFPGDDNRPTNSQFALRVAVFGGIAVVAFAVIFFRLWFLQVLDSEAYLQEANANRVREIKIQAPRGEILDHSGHVLVGNRTVLTLQVRPDELFEDPQARESELTKLARVSGMPKEKIKSEIREQTNLLPASPVTLQQNVDPSLVFYLRERQDDFPGVTADEVFVRDYPEGTLGAHLFGYVSEISEDQLDEPAYDGLDPGDRIGATGIESQYDQVLRGRNGAIRVQVDAFGEPRGRELSKVEPKSGDNLVLTLDEKIQRAGEEALSAYGGGLPGAFVVMDVNDGSILGMGSTPTFDPNIYTPPVSTQAIKSLTNDEITTPLLNRAIQGGYVTGSTYKLITATAGLEEDLITATEPVSDNGTMEYGGREWTNAGSVPNGIVDMTSALRVSSDIYFYKLGIRLEDAGEEALQTWSSNFGFGQLSGIDLPSEGAGLVPTPEWRNQLFEDAADPDSCGGRARLFQEEPFECYETDRPWSVGDNMNLSVGQGDLNATPLQLAVAYAAMGNGGEIVRPHLADRTEDALGATTTEYDPEPKRQIDISEATRTTIMEGLREAAMEPGGTSYPVFGGFPVEIAGKTGTAEKTLQEDQSWFAALAPYDNPRYVVIVTIERGGFGAETAAPAARDILLQTLDLNGSDVDNVDAVGTAAD